MMLLFSIHQFEKEELLAGGIILAKHIQGLRLGNIWNVFGSPRKVSQKALDIIRYSCVIIADLIYEEF